MFLVVEDLEDLVVDGLEDLVVEDLEDLVVDGPEDLVVDGLDLVVEGQRSSSRKPRRSTNKVTLKSLREKAKQLGIKRYSKLKKSELERLINSTKTNTKISTKTTTKISTKTPELECTQMMEATEFVELASDIPKDLKVKFRLSPTVVHCYNIVGLRSWMLAGNSEDPMTRIKFNDKQIKKAKEQWKKLKKAKSAILLQQFKDAMVIMQIQSYTSLETKKEEM